MMGSGELTSSMVEVHKELLRRLADPPRAVFLDTPAGFQLNVDQLSQRAVNYFRSHIQQEMSAASFKRSEALTTYEAEQAFQTLREADFILIGPGSPTYAVRQWRPTPIPEILVQRLESGGCLVAASAAALTVGRFTLPVYELYKVGEDLHWAEGLDTMGHFGFNLVVIPHWNNAEGGSHDTRFCYMGEPRFRRLESLLPEDTCILGLDEHTACLIDLEHDEVVIRGIGRVTFRCRGVETTLERGEHFSAEILRGREGGGELTGKPSLTLEPAMGSGVEEKSFWEKVRALEGEFHTRLENNEAGGTINALLELDQAIWRALEDLESEEFISQAREILREQIVLLGMRLESAPASKADCLAPVVEEMLKLRENFRREKRWPEADAIRESLQRLGIRVEDTPEGTRWRLSS